VLDVSVNADWTDIAADLDEQNAITDDTAVVSDSEDRLCDGLYRRRPLSPT